MIDVVCHLTRYTGSVVSGMVKSGVEQVLDGGEEFDEDRVGIRPSATLLVGPGVKIGT